MPETPDTESLTVNASEVVEPDDDAPKPESDDAETQDAEEDEDESEEA